MQERPTKKVSESAVDRNIHVILPNELNYLNTIFGGVVMAEADKIAAAVAKIHSGQICVTALVDGFRFLAPAKLGELLVFKAAVNRVWRSSMEIGVKAFSLNPLTDENRHIVSAYFTFVPVKDGHSVQVAYDIAPETEDEKRRYAQAELRRQRRLQEKS